ncbi:transglutaminase domain-containing protein [Tamlana haliotis]|uniref:Transglutaminase domain-containing protein n=1 Tax=Pseudotamlana haliotis TaxID=2614804 RepID=A0A6N6MFV0_9FLAO|nr:transglutaminase-like domain-containing protein [Tamlana haliotis]KAB1068679.1 transglutaminase domain-containing protein [Tamlana haliotis]
MLKTIHCLFVAAVFLNTVYAQKNVQPTPEEIALSKSLKEKYPDNSVVLLESSDYISFEFNKNEEKIYVNQESNESIINIDSRAQIQKYSFYDEQTTIRKFEVTTKNDKSTKPYITDEALTNDDLFHHDTRVKYTNISFPLMGYKHNTYISKEYRDIKYFSNIYFNDDYPVLKKVIKIEVPNWLDLELKEFNFEQYSIQKDISTNTKNDSKTFTFTINNIPARYNEPDSPGPTYIYPHLLILAKSYTFDGENKNIFHSTQDLYNWYKSLVTALKNDNTVFKKKVLSLTENTTSDEEKIKNIYYWVQDNIRYIAFEDGIAGFKPDEASNVFDKRYGDCKGMANLLKQMLLEAGFDARLTWIGTKRIAYDYSTPNLSVDNHMICTLFKDGDTIFLDATEKFNAYGEYANRIQGKQALIENNDGYILKTVPEITSDFNRESFNYDFILNDDKLEGKASKTFIGESRTSLLYAFNTLKDNNKEEFLEHYLNNGNTNIEVSNIETTDLLDRELNLNMLYDINIKNVVSSFDSDVYIDIDFDKELEGFLLEKRKTNYIFPYKKDLESLTTLKVPSEYTITHLPKDISFSSKNFDMNVMFNQANNIITYKKIFKIKNGQIEKSDFEKWNQFISNLKSVYNEQIVLTKANTKHEN